MRRGRVFASSSFVKEASIWSSTNVSTRGCIGLSCSSDTRGKPSSGASGCTSALLVLPSEVNFLSRSAIMLIMQFRRNGMVMTISFKSPPATIEVSSSGRSEHTSRPMCQAVVMSFLLASSGFSFLYGAHHSSGLTCLADHVLLHWMHNLVHSSALSRTHRSPLVVWYPSSTKSSAPIRIRSCLSRRVLRSAIMLV